MYSIRLSICLPFRVSSIHHSYKRYVNAQHHSLYHPSYPDVPSGHTISQIFYHFWRLPSHPQPIQSPHSISLPPITSQPIETRTGLRIHMHRGITRSYLSEEIIAEE